MAGRLTNADVDSLDINTTSEDVGGHQDSLLEALELLVPINSLLLRDAGVNADAGEVALDEKLI